MTFSRKIVEDYYLGSPPDLPEKILFIKRETRLAEYKSYLTEVTEFGNVWRGVTGILRGERVAILVTGIGPSMVGDAVYAVERPGAICLYSGTCGGLATQLEIGDYFVTHKAVCGDGYSRLFGYTHLEVVNGDAQVLERLLSAFSGLGQTAMEGATFTTSSVVREHDADFWGMVSPACGIIEMGCASFYAAALKSAKRPAAYFWVTDLPTRGKRFFDPSSPEDQAVKQKTYEAMVAVDVSLLSSL